MLRLLAMQNHGISFQTLYVHTLLKPRGHCELSVSCTLLWLHEIFREQR